MSDEWGPWIEHDGRGCPCIGQWVQAYGVYHDGSDGTQEGIARIAFSWFDENYGKSHPLGGASGRVIRYRIRRPRALIAMIERAQKLDAPNKHHEPA